MGLVKDQVVEGVISGITNFGAFVKIGDERIISFVTSFNNVSLIDTPTYELLAGSEINKVVTISSSVATEAKYFGKSYV